jgi:hypothetical protein
MKKHVALLLVLTLALPAAAVENGQVMYTGGTVPTIKAGALGHLDTTSETSLLFEHPDGKLLIPYADIQSFAYEKEVTRHLGVLPAIGVGLIKMRQYRHFFRISYRNDQGEQVAIFEVPKQMPRTLQSVLASRSPGACKAQACSSQQH